MQGLHRPPGSRSRRGTLPALFLSCSYAASPAATMPAIAAFPSLSLVSPVTPTAPTIVPTPSRMRTPPAAGTMPAGFRPAALMNVGRSIAISPMTRDDTPSASARTPWPSRSVGADWTNHPRERRQSCGRPRREPRRRGASGKAIGLPSALPKRWFAPDRVKCGSFSLLPERGWNPRGREPPVAQSINSTVCTMAVVEKRAICVAQPILPVAITSACSLSMLPALRWPSVSAISDCRML